MRNWHVVSPDGSKKLVTTRSIRWIWLNQRMYLTPLVVKRDPGFLKADLGSTEISI